MLPLRQFIHSASGRPSSSGPADPGVKQTKHIFYVLTIASNMAPVVKDTKRVPIQGTEQSCPHHADGRRLGGHPPRRAHRVVRGVTRESRALPFEISVLYR